MPEDMSLVYIIESIPQDDDTILKLCSINEAYKTASAITIPSTIGGTPVGAVDENLLKDCYQLTSITIEPGFVATEEANVLEQLGTAITNHSNTQSLTVTVAAAEKIDFTKLTGLQSLTITSDGETNTIPTGVCNGAYMRELTIGAGVNAIEPGAFANCNALETVNMESSACSIGDSAFMGCSSLSTIDLVGVSSIGAEAFSGCAALETLDLSTVTAIGSKAFSGCNGLTLTALPVKTENGGSFAADAFAGSSVVNWGSGEPKIEQETGLVYTVGNGAEGSKTAVISGYLYQLTEEDELELVVPASIIYTETSDDGTAVDVKCAVVEVGQSAFAGMTRLKSLSILTELDQIADNAFNGCTGLTEVRLGTVHNVGNRAFYNCTGITKFEATELKVIGSEAFYGVPTMLSYEESTDGNICVTGLSPISSAATEIVIPDMVDGKPVTEISAEAFTGNTNITKVTIQSSSISIGSKAFSGCSNLGEITLPSGECTVATDAFNYCAKLGWGENPQIDEETGLIYSTAISETDNVAYATIYSFLYKNVTSASYALTIPSVLDGYLLIEIADSAFENAGSITSVTIGNSEDEVESLLTRIGDRAFAGCTGLQSFTIDGWASNLTMIGESAFNGCSSLATVQLSNAQNLTKIGAYAFYDCSSLTQMWCYNGAVEQMGEYSVCLTSIMTVGDQAFGNCASLNAYVLLPDSPAEGETEILGSEVFKGTSITGVMVMWNGNCSIPANAFKGLTTIQTVSLSNVSGIGESAFENCTGLTALMLSGVREIGMYAFAGNTSLKEVSIEMQEYDYSLDEPTEVTNASIGAWAFKNCSAITDLNIYGCDECAAEAFEGVTLPSEYLVRAEYAEDTGSYVISGISMYNMNATVLNVPYRVMVDYEISYCNAIKESAFEGNNNLTQVNIAHGIEAIGSAAFRNCTALTYVEIPNSVTTIGDNAFAGCTKLSAVYVPENCNVGENAFGQNTTIYAVSGASLSINYTPVEERLTAQKEAPHDGLEQSVMQQTGLANAIVETQQNMVFYLAPEGYDYYAMKAIDANANVGSWENVAWEKVPDDRIIQVQLENEQNQVLVLAVYYIDEASNKRKYLVTPKMKYINNW